jgi:hypothetical protein
MEMPDIIMGDVILTVGGDFKPGDMPPSGYLDWHEWAEVQHKAGLRQKECGRCGKWKYPQELSDVVAVAQPRDKTGQKVRIEMPVCKTCNAGGTDGR